MNFILNVLMYYLSLYFQSDEYREKNYSISPSATSTPGMGPINEPGLQMNSIKVMGEFVVT